MFIGIVGNRNGWELLDVEHYLRKENITENDIVVTGGAEGVDTYAIWYAKSIGADVIIYHPRLSFIGRPLGTSRVTSRTASSNKRTICRIRWTLSRRWVKLNPAFVMYSLYSTSKSVKKYVG